MAFAVPALAIVAGERAQEPGGVRAIALRIDSTRGELCTGVPVDRQTVLTAAHCVLGGGNFTVTSLAQDFRARRHGVSKIVVHPSFVPGTTPRTQPGADLAIIRLTAPLPGDIEIASIGSGMWTGEALTIAGFGLATEGRTATARTLRQARLVTTGTFTSANSVTVAVDETGLGQEPGAGACRGDSGGPALRGGSTSRDLVGIVSWSSGPLVARSRQVCGGFTSITPVSEHRSWILATVADLGEGQAVSGAAPSGAPRQAATGGNAEVIER